MHKKIWVLLLYLQLPLFAPSQLFGQANPSKSTLGYWFNYGGNHALTEHWSLHTDFLLRNNLLSGNNQQALYRIGVNRVIQGEGQLSLGYAFLKTCKETDQDEVPPVMEHRGWQQYLIKSGIGPLGLQHRWRLEQRFFQPIGNTPPAQSHRMRYLLQLELPMVRLSGYFKNYYLVINNEYFVDFGARFLKASFDRNRLQMGLGYRWSPVFKIQLGYLHQTAAGQGQSLRIVSHFVQLNVMFSLNDGVERCHKCLNNMQKQAL